MKFLHNILSIVMPILFLAFSQYPCADKYVVPISYENTSTNTLTYQEDQSSLQHIDLCSPLCTCTCCAASITSVVLHIDFSYFDMIYNYTPTYYKEIPKGADISIWQPPKIA
ncbi:MAG: hypothetical protein LBI72_08520 [Flavobacteriaceae bacterium]|jgi:hypothetical protein|nr:hypothetical protein [Flavobacteriaceae bacterium]